MVLSYSGLWTMIRVAMIAAALDLGCTAAAAAHTFSVSVAPIRGLMALNQAREAASQDVRNDVLASSETHEEVEAQEIGGYSILDSQPAGDSSSVTGITIHNLQFGSTGLQGSLSRDDWLRGQKLSAMDDPGSSAAAPAQRGENSAFRWESAVRQSLLFLAISHAFRFTTEPSTRADMKGRFWSDYFNSVKGLRGWADGDEFLVNYIGHPIEGAVVGFIQIHNDPKGVREEVGVNKGYWKSRLKAFGWAAAFSTQYEIGLLSEASLGNVGLRPSEKSNHPLAYVDLVVTPVLGTAWLVGEDMIDRYVIRRIESKVKNRWVRAIVRSILNPSRSFANMHRAQWFWHRDDRRLKAGF